MVLFAKYRYFVHKMGKAKQIIDFDKQKKLKLKKETLEKILNQEQVKGLPIVILSVIGAYRTGKSFLLSWLVRYFKADVKVHFNNVLLACSGYNSDFEKSFHT